MSILLDALRKSEQRKLRGEVPTIHSQQATNTGEGPAAWQKPTLLLLPAFLVLLLLAWRQYAPPDDMGWAVVPKPQPRAEHQEGEVPAERGRQEEDGVSATARSPVERLADDGQEPSPPEATAQRAVPATGPDESEDGPAEVAEPEQDMQQALAALQESRPGEQQRPADREAPAQPPESLPRDEWTPGQPEPISYWQLPENTRAQLPPLKITVLVFADRPEDRFVLIDGERMAQGDRVGGAELEEIRPEGAVFRYGGYRFLVKQ